MKLKTSKTAMKRVSHITKSGKILRRKISAQHLTRNKSRRAVKNAKRKLHVSKANAENFRRLIPYGRI